MTAPSRKRKRQDAIDTPATQPDAALTAFADLVAEKAEVFAGQGDGSLVAQSALAVAKKLFDQALAAEPTFLAHATGLFAELVDNGIQTRAKSRRRQERAAKPAENPLLKPTALAELYVDGIQDEQIWEQLDMRASKVGQLVTQLVSGGDDTPVGIDAEEVDEMTIDEAEAAGLDEGEESGSDESLELDGDESDPDEFGLDEAEEEERGEEEELSDAEVSFTQLRDPDDLGRGKRRLSLANLDDDEGSAEGSSPNKKRTEVDDDFFSLDSFLRESEQGEAEMRRMMAGVRAEDAGDDIAEEDDLDLFAALDGGAVDSDDGEGDGMDLGDVADIGYEEFYGPPPASLVKSLGKGKRKAPSPTKRQKATPTAVEPDSNGDRRVRFSEQVAVKPIAARKGSSTGSLLARAQQQGAQSVIDELGDEVSNEEDAMPLAGEASESSESEESDGQEGEGYDEGEDEAIDALKDDLFADDDDAQSDREEEGESRYERRVRALRKQISELEAENVAEREWTMRGEAKSKERPINSLLEEDLDFEQMAKVVPIVTAEATASLEERIKKRILDDNYDDVVRRRPFDPAAYLPSRLLDIAGTQSEKSLAELYEDQYSAERQRAEGREVVHEVDARLDHEHKEIEKLYEDLCNRLDALSNARFTPKAPQTTITTISNQPAVSLESALPSTSTANSLLAPEEVFAGQSGPAKAELTPSEKKAARQRNRRQKAAKQKEVEKLSGSLVVNGRKKGNEKEAAIKNLVGKRGVTVIGKESVAAPKKGKTVARREEQVAQRGSAALKL